MQPNDQWPGAMKTHPILMAIGTWGAANGMLHFLQTLYWDLSQVMPRKKTHALHNSFLQYYFLFFLAWQSLYWGSWHACVDKEQGEWLTCDARACEGHQRPPRGQGHSQGTGRILSGWTFKPRQALEAVKTFDIITPRKHFMYKLYIQAKTFHIQTVHTEQNQEFVPA